MFTPPGENIVETRKCRVSGEDFVVTDRDLEFYNTLSPVIWWVKCSLPAPTLCPNERQMRRMSWRNYDHFYKNTCAVTGKEIVSTYRSHTPYKTVSQEAFWSDEWNPHQYGQAIDFSQPFFDQFHLLDRATPHIALSVAKSVNSVYTNFSVNNRNCYLCSRIAECEDCYYSLLLVRSKNCFDCWDIADSEYLYECIRMIKSYHCFYCTDCENCRDCYFLKDCSGCQDCFGSCNLRNARFVFNNHQLSESDYQKKLEQTLNDLQDFGELRTKFLHYCEQFPKKYMIGFNNEDISGNFLFSNAHVVYGFDAHESENIRYSYGAHNVRDSIDISFGYFLEKSREVCWAYAGYAQFACINCLDNCRDTLYSRDCMSGTTDCFGCVSLKKGKYCILNTPYSQQEYEKMVVKFIDHMKSTGEWGEFFPAHFSPYAYNESSAQVHFPLTKEQVQRREWAWYEEGETNRDQWLTPLPIRDYSEKHVGYTLAQKNITLLLESTLTCIETGKQYRIVPAELAFCIENLLPIPRRHPTCRSHIRLHQTLPAELYDRHCDECWQPFLTSYAPDRPEKILCETCYRNLVY